MSTTLAIRNPYDLPDWDKYPAPVRDDVRQWVWAFENTPPAAPITRWFEAVAAAVGSTVGTVKRKYYALRDAGGDPRVLADARKLKAAEEDLGLLNNKPFGNWIAAQAENRQRKSRGALREFRRLVRLKQPVPGVERYTMRGETPPGASERNLYRVIAKYSDLRHRTAMRLGTTSKLNKDLPQVFSTRKGLWVGAVYQFDDVWHDSYVRLGQSANYTRVLELGAMDLFSAKRIAWGCRPRMPKADGSGMEGIKEREMRFLLANVLHDIGYSPRGTILQVEGGTATIRAGLADALERATNGLVKVRVAGADGRQNALLGFWPGTEGGNFRAKAALESSHNLLHNVLDALPMQTGKDRDHKPVTTERQIAWARRLWKKVAEKEPERLEVLLLPGYDFHTQFLPLLESYYHWAVDERTDHELEGWAEMGFLTTEYTALPGSDQWLTAQEFLGLPAPSQVAITEAAKMEPAKWTRRRKLCPNEVFAAGARDLRRCNDALVVEILGGDLAREMTVKGSYFRCEDQLLGYGEHIWESRVRTPAGEWMELRSGEKFACFVNPFAVESLFVCDAQLRLIGTAPLVMKPNAIDQDAVKAAWGHKAQRTADILAPMRARHGAEVREAEALRAANPRIVKGGELEWPEDLREARRERRAQAERTARIDSALASREDRDADDSDAILEAWAAPCAPAGAEPDEDEAEPFAGL